MFVTILEVNTESQARNRYIYSQHRQLFSSRVFGVIYIGGLEECFSGAQIIVRWLLVKIL